METTTDVAHGGRVALEQPRDGYRFNADSIYLAAQVARERPHRVLDVGAGVGVIGLCIADRAPTARITFVERQEALAALCTSNVARAEGRDADVVVQADIRTWRASELFDAVVLNPPYYREEDGRVNPEPTRAAARHQLHGTLEELVVASVRHLERVGSLHMVYPAAGCTQVCAILDALGLRAVEARFVHPRIDAAATTVLLRASHAARRRFVAHAPLVCYTPSGSRSPEAERLWRGE